MSNVTNTNAYDARHWDLISGNAHISGLIKKAKSTPEIAGDVFQLLYKQVTDVNPAVQSPEATRLRELVASREYKVMRRDTAGSPVRSVIGTLTVIERWRINDEAPPNGPHGPGRGPGGGDPRDGAAQEAYDEASEAEESGRGPGRGRSTKPDGIEPEEIGDLLSLAKRIGQNRDLARIAELAGRIRRVLRESRATVRLEGAGTLDGTEAGGIVTRLIPSELIKLKVPALRASQAKRVFMDRVATQWRYTRNEVLGRGPLVHLVDASGSMCGEELRWAKAVSLALLDACGEDKRTLRLTTFDHEVQETRTFEAGAHSFEDVSWVLGWSAGGGTSFNPAIAHALDIIESSEPRADIVISTDGDGDLSPEIVNRCRDAHDERGTSIYGVMITQWDDISTDGHTLSRIVDQENFAILNINSEDSVDQVTGGVFTSATEKNR